MLLVSERMKLKQKNEEAQPDEFQFKFYRNCLCIRGEDYSCLPHNTSSVNTFDIFLCKP